MRDALEATGAKVTADAPLRRRAFWRVGGPAELLVEPTTASQLAAVLALAPVTVLGNGSNALIHDEGIPGVVLRLRGELAGLRHEEGAVWAGGGLLLAVLLKRLDDAGLAGAEPFVGVPGTVGGAVVMNAGTRMGEASDIVEAVEVALPSGQLARLHPASLAFAYRHAELPPGSVVTRAKLKVVADPDGARKAERQQFLARRKATQPLDLPSCGSTFTNPPGDAAGRLIEAAGLKGTTRGGAQISEKHANFIVNLGGAAAEDIRWLIAHARCVVRERFGVWMTPEVKLLGDWPAGALDQP